MLFLAGSDQYVAATNVQMDTDGCEPVSSRTCSNDRCGMDISSATTPKQNCALQLSKMDTAITQHILGSLSCWKAVAKDVLHRFTILAQGRSAMYLSVLEAIFIDQNQPVLLTARKSMSGILVSSRTTPTLCSCD